MEEKEVTQQTTIKRKTRKLEKGKELEIVGETEKRTVNKKLPPKKLPQLSFDAWWMRTQKKYGFGSEMKEVVFKHFKARGFLKSNKFDEGLKDFGLKS